MHVTDRNWKSSEIDSFQTEKFQTNSVISDKDISSRPHHQFRGGVRMLTLISVLQRSGISSSKPHLQLEDIMQDEHLHFPV